jgi:hypothetical protein
MERPFVIYVLVAVSFGQILATPVGVELAPNAEEARDQARRRWPGYPIIPARPWETVSQHNRMVALERDRQIFN